MPSPMFVSQMNTESAIYTFMAHNGSHFNWMGVNICSSPLVKGQTQAGLGVGGVTDAYGSE